MMNENKTCPNCNHAVKPTWKICPYCKQMLKGQQGVYNQPKYGNVAEKKDYPIKSEGRSKLFYFLLMTFIVGSLVLIGEVLLPFLGLDNLRNREYSDENMTNATIVDSRDFQTYRTVMMPDGKLWLAENLRFSAKSSWCYDNLTKNCEKYGRLYDWQTAKSACPNGWHLPSGEEFETLLEMVGGDEEERSLNLRAPSWDGGLDKYVFSALPAGYYDGDNKEFYNLGRRAYFWSSTEDFDNRAYYLTVGGDYLTVDGDYKTRGNSVRCLQD